jgi:dTDP-3-amino-3,4,6-trideoxy-alpha-D-glucose transaminase
MTAVPTKSYPRQYQPIWPVVQQAIEDCMLGDKPILGAMVDRFEARLAGWWGVPYVVGTNSGTGAAQLLYRALDLPRGAVVMTNAQTFPGVLAPLVLAGLRPRLVDADPSTGRMTPDRVAAALTDEVAAVLVVHMHGHPEPIDAIADLCKAHEIPLIEDCAQAHGARWKGRPVGTLGVAAITSFHPSKNLGAFGDGGAVLTTDPALAASLRVLRNLGKAGKYRFEEVGPNEKLDSLQAAILAAKLPFLDGWNARRSVIARRYLQGLNGLAAVRLPVVHADADPVWHLFVVRTPRRDALKAWLAERGIASGLHYPIAAPDHPAFADAIEPGDWPHARQWAAECLSLPLSFEHTDAEIHQVIAAVRAWANR